MTVAKVVSLGGRATGGTGGIGKGGGAGGAGGGGRSCLLLASVIRPLTTHPERTEHRGVSVPTFVSG